MTTIYLKKTKDCFKRANKNWAHFLITKCFKVKHIKSIISFWFNQIFLRRIYIRIFKVIFDLENLNFTIFGSVRINWNYDEVCNIKDAIWF